jgi:hypothetical protein
MNALLDNKVLLAATLALAPAAAAPAIGATYAWIGDDSSAYTNGNNWYNDTTATDNDGPGDGESSAVLLFDNRVTNFSLALHGTQSEHDYGVFAPGLSGTFTTTVGTRPASQWQQNSSQIINFGASMEYTGNTGGWTGSGSGTVNYSGNTGRLGANSLAFTINNPGFTLDWSGNLGSASDNDTYSIVKDGAGAAVASGTYYVDTNTAVNAGTFTLNGTLKDADVVQAGGLFNGSGTIEFGINGLLSEMIDVNGGVFNGSGLTLAFDVGINGVTESEYVLVDYSGGGTFTPFGTYSNVPSGYTVQHDVANQRLVLVPEPAAISLLAAAVPALLRRRRGM